MNYDEFAFFNQQLGSMLKDGIPLEGAVGRLSEHMRRGRLKGELDLLERDLAKGTPLNQAVWQREFPLAYKQMVRIGVKAGNLPRVLLLLADYYQSVNTIRTRLKGIMVYPAIVLVLALVFSFFFALQSGSFLESFSGDEIEPITWSGTSGPNPLDSLTTKVLLPPITMSLFAVFVVVAFSVPRLRQFFRWRIVPFKDASLAQAGQAMAMMLRGGCSLSDAITMLWQIESGTTAGAELERWQIRLREGHCAFAGMTEGGCVFPKLFVWLVDSAGEDMATGFERAAEVYSNRARYRVEMLLYGALPVSMLVLGAMFLTQAYSIALVWRWAFEGTRTMMRFGF